MSAQFNSVLGSIFGASGPSSSSTRPVDDDAISSISAINKRSSSANPVTDPATKKVTISRELSDLLRSGLENGTINTSVISDLVRGVRTAVVVDLTSGIPLSPSVVPSVDEYASILSDIAKQHATALCSASDFVGANDFHAHFLAVTLPAARDTFSKSSFLRVTDIFGVEQESSSFFADNRPVAPQVPVDPPGLEAFLSDLSSRATSYAQFLGNMGRFSESAQHMDNFSKLHRPKARDLFVSSNGTQSYDHFGRIMTVPPVSSFVRPVVQSPASPIAGDPTIDPFLLLPTSSPLSLIHI